MIQPVLKDDAFLEDVRSAGHEANGLHLWWLGQSGYLVGWQNHFLLIDPYLSDSLTHKYAGTDRPHVRMTERVVAPERLGLVDVVASTHNHTDHLDGETLIPILNANPGLTVVVGRANLDFAATRLHVHPERLTPIQADGDPVTAGPFTLWAIPSAHETLETDDNGDHRYIGYILQAGKWTIYHSGDACPYIGLAERLINWKLDIAILPINGRDPKRGVAGNFTPHEAVALSKEIGVGIVIPCHYEMFEFNTVSPLEFVTAAESLDQPYRLLKCGERFNLRYRFP